MAGLQHLKSFQDVRDLRLTELRKICRSVGLDTSYGRHALVNLLCHVLKISTTGSRKSSSAEPRPKNCATGLTSKQLREFASLDTVLLSGLSGWEKDLRIIPDTLDDGLVKKYLKDSDQISPEMNRSYKISRPYQLKAFVHSMKVHRLPDHPTFLAVQAQCNPSQSAQADDVKVIFVIMDAITAQPYGGYCTCTVGYCQCCGHMGAVLFRIADFISAGNTHFPDDAACTDGMATWTDPKGVNVTPKRLDDIRVGQHVSNSSSRSGLRRTSQQYGQVVVRNCSTSKTIQAIRKLRADLFAATQHLGIHVPAVHVLTPQNFPSEGVEEVPAVPTKIPERVSGSDPRLLPVLEVCVTNHPLPITKLSVKDGDTVETFIDRIYFSAEDRRHIQELTLGQRENINWYKQRAGSITSTKMLDINKFYSGSKISSDRIVKDILGTQFDYMVKPPAMPSRDSLKWGIVNEARARKLYSTLMSREHRNFSVTTPGLVVHPEFGFIRASPDGIASCDCHPPRLLEIKCPYSLREEEVIDIVEKDMVPYLSVLDGEVVLQDTSGEGYLTQVQATMAVTELKSCDFVMYTKKGLGIVPVAFNPIQWCSILNSSKKFFREYVVPSIIGISGGLHEIADFGTVDDVSLVLMADEMEMQSDDAPTEIAVPAVPSIRCEVCLKPLPEPDFIDEDNSNASVGCECLCKCDVWVCWSCAGYTQETADSDFEWFCDKCRRRECSET